MLVGSATANAAGVFYVDGSNPACSDLGPGTAANPYCTISAAAAAHSGPGTTLLVKPGVYREQVDVPASGAAGNAFVIQALGPGVVVDGADDFSTPALWAAQSGGIYLAAGVTWSPVQVLVDGARLTPSGAAVNALPAASFRYVDGSGLYVNVDGGNPGGHQCFVGRRASAFVLAGDSWVRVAGFSITRTDDKGIHLVGPASNDTITGNHVSFAGSAGIGVEGCTHLLIASNVVSDCAHHGISLRIGVTASTVQDNESFRNSRGTEPWPNGIYLSESSGNLIQRNNLHHNQDTGLEIQSGSNDNTSIQNLSWSNGDHGFEHLFATGTRDIGDVAWGNHTDGFSIEGSATNTALFDCIGAENGLSINEYDLYIDAGSTTGFVSDYNLFWHSTSQPSIKYAGVVYPLIADYRAASGQDAHSLQADPRFVAPAVGDFHLQSTSPAIDDATTSVAGWPSVDALGHARVDDPATPNTGTGPVLFADRGALEFVLPTASVMEARVLPVPLLSDATPNPSRGHVSFTLDTREPTRVEWGVVDVQGREFVRVEGQMLTGRTALRWNGRDAAGTPVPAGLYWVVVKSGGTVTSKRFVVLR